MPVRWLLRAGWTAQELLTTFTTELGEVALIPGTGGVFDVRLDGETVRSRKEQEGFPDLAVLKQLVRGWVAPDRSLGHTDRKHSADDLLERARCEDIRHRELYQRPISSEALRQRLRVGSARSRRLVKAVRSVGSSA